MRSHLHVIALATAATLQPLLIAQAPHQGNGIGAAFLDSSAAVIGASYSATWGSPNAPLGMSAFCSSDDFAPQPFPVLGNLSIGFASPVFYFRMFALDAQGEATASIAIPNTPSLVSLPPLYALVIIAEPSGFSISKTVRIEHENADAWRQVGNLAEARAQHTATALGEGARDNDSRVLVAGGGGGTILQPLATDTTEIYVPLTRTFEPGPTMAVERTLHRSVRLNDGRVLLLGGSDSGGIVTQNCEIFDPANDSLTPTGSLTTPRVGHAATLLNDGRVFVSGGLSDYVDPTNNFIAVMNSAQDTAEIFDPATGLWTAVPGTIGGKRSGHSQVMLANGNVLMAGGIQGATLSTFGLPVPIYTNSCTVYDPATNSFAVTGSMPTTRAFFGMSTLSNGDVLATGGSVSNVVFGTVASTANCEVWNGTNWTAVGALPNGLTNHVQVAANNGNAMIIGGFTGSFPNLTPVEFAGRHDGTGWTATAAIGSNPGFPAAPVRPTGAATATRLADGMWLLVGGTDGAAPLTETFVYLEP